MVAAIIKVGGLAEATRHRDTRASSRHAWQQVRLQNGSLAAHACLARLLPRDRCGWCDPAMTTPESRAQHVVDHYVRDVAGTEAVPAQLRLQELVADAIHKAV